MLACRGLWWGSLEKVLTRPPPFPEAGVTDGNRNRRKKGGEKKGVPKRAKQVFGNCSSSRPRLLQRRAEREKRARASGGDKSGRVEPERDTQDTFYTTGAPTRVTREIHLEGVPALSLAAAVVAEPGSPCSLVDFLGDANSPPPPMFHWSKWKKRMGASTSSSSSKRPVFDEKEDGECAVPGREQRTSQRVRGAFGFLRSPRSFICQVGGKGE